MTATRSRPNIPKILPTGRPQPTIRGAIADGLRHADRPWSIGVDVLVLACLVGGLCWEVWEFGGDGEWPHLAFACACLVANVLYAFRAFTIDREDHDR